MIDEVVLENELGNHHFDGVDEDGDTRCACGEAYSNLEEHLSFALMRVIRGGGGVAQVREDGEDLRIMVDRLEVACNRANEQRDRYETITFELQDTLRGVDMALEDELIWYAFWRRRSIKRVRESMNMHMRAMSR